VIAAPAGSTRRKPGKSRTRAKVRSTPTEADELGLSKLTKSIAGLIISVSLGGELGGLGASYKIWSSQVRGSMPF